MKIAIVSAALGGACQGLECVDQISFDEIDVFRYTDENFPPRKTMSARLQAKIPKMFGWLLQPDYDYYLWLDSHFYIQNQRAVDWLLRTQGGMNADISVFGHPQRDMVTEERDFISAELQKNNNYIVSRYADEWYNKEWFNDDLQLYACGMILYKNIEIIRRMLQDWFNEVVLYNVNDQLSFPYVLKKHSIVPNVIDGNILHHPVFKYRSHKE